MHSLPLLTHGFIPASTCEQCAIGDHVWGEPDDEHFDGLALRRWYCRCQHCPHCTALSVAVAATERWHGQHRLT